MSLVNQLASSAFKKGVFLTKKNKNKKVIEIVGYIRHSTEEQIPTEYDFPNACASINNTEKADAGADFEETDHVSPVSDLVKAYVTYVKVKNMGK